MSMKSRVLSSFFLKKDKKTSFFTFFRLKKGFFGPFLSDFSADSEENFDLSFTFFLLKPAFEHLVGVFLVVDASKIVVNLVKSLRSAFFDLVQPYDMPAVTCLEGAAELAFMHLGKFFGKFRDHLF